MIGGLYQHSHTEEKIPSECVAIRQFKLLENTIITLKVLMPNDQCMLNCFFCLMKITFLNLVLRANWFPENESSPTPKD